MITRHGVYIDGFAGPQQPELPDSWAARLVLENEPRWLRTFFLCDEDEAKVAVLRALKDAQPEEPPRLIEVYHGNFNVTEILASGEIGPKVATFCLLDQRTFEREWRTVQALAGHKLENNKIELFYFVGTGWLHRALSGVSNSQPVERWWGRSDWSRLAKMRQQDCADLFCRRFHDELGYKFAHAWPIYERQGSLRVMYYMIHATDHTEGPNLMARAYRKATGTPEPFEQLHLEFGQWQAKQA